MQIFSKLTNSNTDFPKVLGNYKLNKISKDPEYGVYTKSGKNEKQYFFYYPNHTYIQDINVIAVVIGKKSNYSVKDTSDFNIMINSDSL